MYISTDICFIIGLFIEMVFGIIYCPRAGIIITAIIAIAKEIEDQDRYGAFEWTCTVALMCGAAAGYIFLGTASFYTAGVP